LKGRRKTKTEEKTELKKDKIRLFSKRERKSGPSSVSRMKSESSRKSTWDKSKKKYKRTENYQRSYLIELSCESCKCEVLHKFS